MRFFTGAPILGAAVLAATIQLAGTAAHAQTATINATTTGTLTVSREGNLSANVGQEVAPNSFYDVYTGTYTLSASGIPAVPVTQPYAFTLTGPLTVGDNTYAFDSTPLPTASASNANLLTEDYDAFISNRTGLFFPDFLPNTYYTYNPAGDITIASQTDLASIFPDTGPLSVLYTDGTSAISAPALTFVGTPIAASAVPEPASFMLIAVGLIGLAAVRRSVGPQLST